MAHVITAPSLDVAIFSPVVFLAGGISKCKDWQKEVIRELASESITLINPRQESFDVSDKNASFKQIEWEFNRLEKMDIFSMYFCNSESVQPICMYELGRNVLRMQNRFPSDWEKRIIISVEKGYSRREDVVTQIYLCAPFLFVETAADPITHARYIRRRCYDVRKQN